MMIPHRNSLSEQEMLRSLRSKDGHISGWLVCQVECYMRHYLKHRTGDYLYLAKSIASEAVTIIIQKEKEPVLTCKLLTYAIGIARRRWSLIEQKKRECPITDMLFDEIETTDDIYEELEKSERRLLVNMCLERITKKCQELLGQFCNGFSSEEVYLKMSYSSKKVYQVKKSECLERLKMEIEHTKSFPELIIKNLKQKTHEHN